MSYKKRVALLYGGRGLEHSVSVEGAKNIISLINRERYEIIPTYISKNGDLSLRAPSSKDAGRCVHPIFKDGRGAFLAADGEIIPIDCAFPLLHGDFGEDGTIQGLLASLGIPFVGCDARASAICLDKAVTKSVAEALDIPTVEWRLVTDGKTDKLNGILPAFVKPDCLGSSYGAGVAKTQDDLVRAFADADLLGSGRVLVEKFKSPIRELELAYFSAQGEKIFSSAGEILCNGFYSYDKKYIDNTKTVAVADIPQSANERMREYSEALCSFIGIRHLARIDFFLSGDEIFLNEINTMPGMTETSLYLKLLSSVGISPAEAINRLISDVIEVSRT